ncbi:MAG: MBL fold metallo-hydrolase [Sedimentisphaerales bacterium]|jgi:ribonuclease Z|nr:MBL fold metallo-hydrolase [Sedimentisphaerales bacterium]
MPSHDLATLRLCDLDIIGYSVGGEETVVAVPQLDVCFDIGKAPDQVICINFVLLTHGHIDHAAGFAYYLSHRQFNGQNPGTIVAPKGLLGPLRQILDAWADLDGNKIPGNLIGVGPGDEVQIKPNLFARAFPTDHCRGSVGYCILERRKKLRPEYVGLSGQQIVELKDRGVTVDYPLELPIITYLGDTRYIDYSMLDYVANSRILVVECTFFEQEHADRADAGRHIHVRDLPRLLGNLRNEHVVLVHITQRTPLAQARRLLKESLPADLLAKVVILMDHRQRRQSQ